MHLPLAATIFLFGMASNNQDDIRDAIQNQYGEMALKGQSCCGSSKPSCCSSKSTKGANLSSPDDFAKALGYTAEELEALPEGANMGLSCGNPTAMASLKPGDVVLDLGSGGGFDVFVAARKVGETGRSIGVDMTPAMIRKARQNAAQFEKRTGLNNVEFRLGEIEHLPLADASVDVIISNCVINLSPEKQQVWREAARVLKPGGRICISDIALLRPLPDSLRTSIAALVGCVAGAVLLEETHSMIEAAGLVVTSAEKEAAFVHNMERNEDPLYKNVMKLVPEGMSPGDYVTSVRLIATKPPSEAT